MKPQILSVLLILTCFRFFLVYSEEVENETYIVKEINVTGNKRTKSAVIISELPFQAGSTINRNKLEDLLERAELNILNTSLFNKVTIETQIVDNYNMIFNITVDERWYLWFLPIFENEGRNFSDFLKRNDGSWYNYGIYIKHYNFRGLNEKISLRAITGYKDQLIFDYENSGRNNSPGWGLLYRLQQNNQIPYSISNDKQMFMKLKNNWAMRQNRVELNFFFRHDLYQYHRLSAVYENINISDTLYALNSKYLPLDKQKSSQFILAYRYKYDTRDLKIFPLDGNYVEAYISRVGLGIISDYKGFFDGKFTMGVYRPLVNRLYSNSDLVVRGYSKKEIPFFFNAGYGYDDYLNGFEYKVVEGSFYTTLKNMLLFELIERKDKTLNFIPIRQFSKFHYAFYLHLHADVGYVYKNSPIPENKLPNSFLFGYGVGIDLVTIYDKVLRINYSRTNFGEQGFFIHFNLSL